jgi:DNA-binding response OmpR family regulator
MTQRRILIVDDEQKVAFFLSQALERSNRNYDVTIAHSGEEAMEYLRETEVDLLVTDLRMPGISGLELVRWARTNSPTTRTILITAYGSTEVEAEASRLQTDHYIAKPFAIDVFTQAVQEALHPSPTERALISQRRLRDLLTSLIFHELRVPLTYIMSCAGILSQEGDNPQDDLPQVILRHATRMRDALDDLTMLGEWSISQFPGYLQTVNMHQALETSIAQSTSLAVGRQQTLNIVPASEPVQITTDAWLLGVLVNAVLATAIRNTPVEESIQVDIEQEDERVLVRVQSNSDVAIDELGSVNGSVSLTVARKLVKAMGGDLKVTPNGEGEVAYEMTLPADPPLESERLAVEESIPASFQ